MATASLPRDCVDRNAVFDAVDKVTLDKDPLAVKQLLPRCSIADINAADFYGYTPLMEAFNTYGSPHMKLELAAKPLLEAKADVNALTRNGWTALMHAVRWKDIESAECLIAAGADVNTVSRDGLMNALHAVLLCFRPHTFDVFREAQDVVNAMAAQDADATSVAKFLVEHNANLDGLCAIPPQRRDFCYRALRHVVAVERKARAHMIDATLTSLPHELNAMISQFL